MHPKIQKSYLYEYREKENLLINGVVYTSYKLLEPTEIGNFLFIWNSKSEAKLPFFWKIKYFISVRTLKQKQNRNTWWTIHQNNAHKKVLFDNKRKGFCGYFSNIVILFEE